jgi:hypothetical protein
MSTNRKVSIDRIHVYTDEAGEGFAYAGNTDLRIPEDSGGHDFGRIMVRLDVDGGGPIVYADLGRTGDLAGLMAAADALNRTIAQLSQLYPADGSQRLGQCLACGDWGRCRGEHGHDGEHLFPTEAIWKAEYDSFEAAKAAGSGAKS